MLNCMRLTEIVTDYLEQRLSLLERMQFHLHVGMCKHCREYLRQTKLVVRASRDWPRPAMPPDGREELLRRFRAWDDERDDGPAK